MTLATYTRLGPYELVGRVGAGGMGEVWKARDPKLDRFVAIKILPETFMAEPDRVARFEREAQVLDLLAQGLTNKEIAEKLGISYETVHTYIRRIYEKLQVRTRTEAVAKFLRR